MERKNVPLQWYVFFLIFSKKKMKKIIEPHYLWPTYNTCAPSMACGCVAQSRLATCMHLNICVFIYILATVLTTDNHFCDYLCVHATQSYNDDWGFRDLPRTFRFRMFLTIDYISSVGIDSPMSHQTCDNARASQSVRNIKVGDASS